MFKQERRHLRSDQAHLALNLFLDSIRERDQLGAVAVTTEDGFLIGGAGAIDLEWMGALGASSQRATLKWEGTTLHVQKLEVNRTPMFVTSSDRRTNAKSVKEGLERILAS